MRTHLRNLYAWSLGTTALLGIWYYLLVGFWPWHADTQWQGHYRIVALCASPDGGKTPAEACTLRFAELDAARASGKVTGFADIPSVGDTADTESWHHWQRGDSEEWDYEVSWSSWDFKESVRYRLNPANTSLSLVAHRHVGPPLLEYAIPLTALTLLLIALRRRFK